MFGQNVNQQVADSMIEETEQRWDGQRRESNGQFGKGKKATLSTVKKGRKTVQINPLKDLKRRTRMI